MELLLNSLFCFIDLCFCFYANIILFSWQELCHTVCNQEVWCLQLCLSSCPVNQWWHPTHLIFCCHLLFLPSIFPSIRDFSIELVVYIRWPKYWSFSFSISPSKEYSGLISFKSYWFDLLAFQETLKSLLQHHSSPSLRDPLVPLCFVPLEWYHLHIWGCWYFSCQSWFQLVTHPAWHFAQCALHVT